MIGLKKSVPVKPKPKANMINAKAIGKKTSVTIPIIFNLLFDYYPKMDNNISIKNCNEIRTFSIIKIN